MFRAWALPGTVGDLSGQGWPEGCGCPDARGLPLAHLVTVSLRTLPLHQSTMLASPVLWLRGCSKLPREGGGAAMSNPGSQMDVEAQGVGLMCPGPPSSRAISPASSPHFHPPQPSPSSGAHCPWDMLLYGIAYQYLLYLSSCLLGGRE